MTARTKYRGTITAPARPRGRLWRLALIALGIVVVIGLASAGAAEAQEAPDDPEPGDLLWTFAQEPPFYDQRVHGAFGVYIDEQAVVEAAGADDVRLVPVFLEPPEGFRVLPDYPPTDAEPLMMAAGFQPGSFTEAGTCQVWVAPAEGDPAPDDATREAVASELGEALLGAIEEMGTQVEPCEITTSPEEAHVLVWAQGEEPPEIPQRDEPTFLTWPQAVPPPPVQDGGTGGGGAGGPEPHSTGPDQSGVPTPGWTGNGGPALTSGDTAPAGAWLAAAGLLSLLPLARVASGHLEARRSER